MKAFAHIFIILLLSACLAEAGDVKLEGISGDVILVNGQVLQVGDSIDGVKITGINNKTVTFQDENGATFTETLEVTFWDQTVQKIREIFDKTTRQAKGSARQNTSGNNGDGFFQGLIEKFSPGEPVPQNLSLSEKMRFADANLREFKENGRELISELERKDPAKVNIRKAMQKFNALAKRENQRFNDLKLPCPQSREVAGNPGKYSSYISWTEDFRGRRQKTADDLFQKLEKIFARAGK